MYNMKTIQIVGYEQEGNCEHCGRSLKHCIRISDGRIVGATCLDKQITKPKIYNGKRYRVGSNQIIRMARIIERYSLSDAGRMYGIYGSSLTFELA